MAQTDTRPGFRLPWSSDRTDADAATPPTGTDEAAAEATDVAVDPTTTTDIEATAEAVAEDMTATADAIVGTAGHDTTDASTEVAAEAWPHVETAGDSATVTESAVSAVPEPVAAPATKKPNKLMADLSRAMQAAAEAARSETMERFTADAKSATERVHAVAAEESAELRRVADEDVSGIRDWSKAEIARIREETENRISGRKGDLERQLEQHAGTIESRIERVNAFVAAFEAEMAAFFERLSAETDPARLAAMAEQLPEAPSLDLAELDAAVLIGASTRTETTSTQPEAVAATSETTEATAVTADDDAPSAGSIEATTEVVEGAAAGTSDATAEVSTEATATADTTTDATADTTEAVEASTEAVEADPRIAALGLSGVSDFAAAEAEAAFAADAAAESAASEEADEIPTIADEVLAARIAGLVPDDTNSTNPLVTTKVIVSGLVSVASIAGFKRHLSRLQGVTTVGVSSGPDGEFVFSVHHLPTVDLSAGITSLPGFDTRITGQDDGTVTVTARDPESHD
jgi:hypothetical protein